MRTRQIEVLQAILRTGSVSGAARLLHVSQPAVTRTLQHAEATVGFALFKRQGNRLVPTAETNALAPMVERASSSLESVRKLARNLKLGDDRPIRIAAVPSLAVSVLPGAYTRTRAMFPQMHTELGSAHVEDITQKLLLHEIDIGVAFDPPPHPFVDNIDIGELSLVAAALPAKLGKHARQKRISAEALATMDLIEMSGKDPLGQIYARCAAHYGWPHTQTAVQTYHVGLRLAELGQGVALIDSASASHCGPALKVLPLEPAVTFPVCVLLLKDTAVTDIMEGFIQCLREELGKYVI
ncbi:MAG: LysR family transcriptional regulator [Comamonadaceae bacterium]|nr:MAG: LysR family transcriptional regulator [Comamonadaceae bacterium]